MRIERKTYQANIRVPGVRGTLLDHENNTLRIRVDGHEEPALDLYWNWEPLDEAAAEYLDHVAKTAKPMGSDVMTGRS